jgi:hypothetical protein
MLALSLVLSLTLAPAHAAPLTAQSSVYLPIVHQSSELVLSDLAIYYSKYVMFFVGEVSNVSATQAFSVTIRAVIRDHCPGITQTFTPTTGLPAVLPQQRTPFNFSLTPPACSEDIVRELAVDQAIPITASRIRSLTVLPQTIQCNNFFPYAYGSISGMVRNDNLEAVTRIVLVTWSLRADNSRGYGRIQIDGPLAPGAEVPFSAGNFPQLCDENGQPDPRITLDSFQFAAQGTVLP